MPLSSPAQDSQWKFTYEGYLEESGAPVDGTKAFRFQVLGVSGGQKCVLFDENQTLQVDKGNFVARVGAGTRHSSDPGLALRLVYGSGLIASANLKDDSGATCPPFDPTGAERYLRVYVGAEKIGDVLMTRAPMATHAADSDKVGGKAANEILQTNTTTQLTQANLEMLVQSLVSSPGSSVKWNSSTTAFDSYDPANGALLTDASVPWAKLSQIPGALTELAVPSIANCADGKILKRSGGSWSCDDDASGAGTVTGVTSANSYITIASNSTAPVLTLNVGSGPNTVAAGDDARFGVASKIGTADIDTTGVTNGKILKYDGANSKWIVADDDSGGAPSGAASGDLLGTYPGPTVKAIRNTLVSGTTPQEGQFFKFTSGQWTPVRIGLSDLKKVDGVTSQLPGSQCSQTEAMIWSSVSDSLICQAINLSFANISGTVVRAQLPVGTSSSSVAAGDDARFGVADKIIDKPISISSLSDKQVLKYNAGTSTWQNSADSDTLASVSCPSGYLTKVSGNWVCSTPTEVDPSVAPYAKLAPGNGLYQDGPSQQLMVSFGTTAGTVAAGNDGRLPTSGATCSAGLVYAWNGSAWGCTSVTATDSTKVAKTGDVMSGSLAIGRATGSASDTLQVYSSGGNAGVTITGSSAGQSSLNFMTTGALANSLTSVTNGSGWQLYSYNSTSGTPAGQFGLTYYNGSGWYQAMKVNPTTAVNSGGEVGLYTNGTERLRIQNDGKIGVGTSSPGETLSVNGTLSATGAFKAASVASSAKTHGAALSGTLALDFSDANTIRSTSSSSACGNLNVTSIPTGAFVTFTALNATTTCGVQLNGVTSNVKLPSGYAAGTAVSGVIYSFLYDGITLWVSYVPY